VVDGQNGDCLLKNWTENDADLQRERVLCVEVVIALRVGSLESKVVANRVTIIKGKDDNGNCLLGGGNLNWESPAIGDDHARSICLNALRIRECLLEALRVQRVHLDGRLSDVRLRQAKTFYSKAGCTLLVETLLFDTLLFETLPLSTLLIETFLFETLLVDTPLFETLPLSTLLIETFLLETLLLSTLLSFSAKLLFSFFFGLTGCLFGFLDFTCLLDIVSTLLRVIGKTEVTLDSRRRARFCRKASSLAFFWEI
jgi:hypothetical protein